LSFFDEDDEPTRRAPRPRRAAPAGGHDVDQQTLWTRRGIALGGGLLIFVLLVIAVRACQSSAHKNALRDYNREAQALLTQSDGEVGKQFFDTMHQAASQSPEDLQTQISSLRVQSETILDQAKKLSTPDELAHAQTSLLEALELRRDGLDYIASHISAALGDQGDVADQALRGVTSQMQAFLASNVLIQSRVTPVDKEELKNNDVVADPVHTDPEAWMPGFSWLNPAYVADQLGTRITVNKRNPNQPIAPGLHGNGIVSTGVGDVTLQPDPAANKVPVGGDLTFKVTFANQGENDEFDVEVSVTLEGNGKPIKAKKTVDTIAKGQQTTVNLALPKKPAAGEVYTVTSAVKPVPGEKKTDNNKSTYPTLFVQG
jgi:CARDB protein